MAQNFAPFPFGDAVTSVASGDGLIGDLYQDKDGNQYRMVINAGSAVINDGQPCEFKSGADAPSGVIPTSAASGIGKVLAGIAKLDVGGSGNAGEAFYVQVDGVVDNGYHSSAAIVDEDPLTVSASGTRS